MQIKKANCIFPKSIKKNAKVIRIGNISPIIAFPFDAIINSKIQIPIRQTLNK